MSVHVACGHGSEASLVGSKEEQLRSKLLVSEREERWRAGKKQRF